MAKNNHLSSMDDKIDELSKALQETDKKIEPGVVMEMLVATLECMPESIKPSDKVIVGIEMSLMLSMAYHLGLDTRLIRECTEHCDAKEKQEEEEEQEEHEPYAEA